VAALSELESSAQHLRACLSRTQGLHALLCRLQFFSRLKENIRDSVQTTFIEASLREFVPDLATALRLSPPDDLLPDEINSLQGLIALIRSVPGVVSETDVGTFERFGMAAGASHLLEPPPAADDDQVVLAGLFVEHHPELRLAPRGRLLWLRVEAEERKRGKTDDQAVLRNTTIRPDDEFRRQADHAVRLAREYLTSKHGLDPKKRFRVDFEVEGVTSSLTGPSLGLALAVGAAVAMARRAILRDTLDVPSGVAFSGALSPDGSLISIDGEGLRLKLTRAIHSGLRHVVVPRAHITEAWDFVREHPARDSQHTLNLAAADDLVGVLNDRNLVFPQRRTRTSYGFLRFRKKTQEPRIGIPIFLALVAILGFIAWPYIQSWIDQNPVELREIRRGFTVYNQYGRSLWSKEFVCDSINSPGAPPYADRNWRIGDFDGDNRNEIIYAPVIARQSPDANWFFCFEYDGQLRFRRYCPIIGEYPGDSGGVLYDFEYINIPRVAGQPIIVTEVGASSPGRSHIRLWSIAGDSLGWYINAGGSKFVMAEDLSGDGREELLFHCYFHRLNGTSLLALSVDSAYG
jgi:hypothetical protein